MASVAVDNVMPEHLEDGAALPAGWNVVRLGDISDIVMGQSPPSTTYNEEGNGLPFLQGKAEFGPVYPQPSKWCSEPLKIAGAGAVLISVRAPVGDVNIAPFTCAIGRGLAAIQVTNADALFTFYWLHAMKRRLDDLGTGSTFKSINRGVLTEFPVVYPPLPEQRAIAHVLRTVQQAKEATEAVIAATRELKRSLMRHLFTYGPVPVDQADQVALKETEFGDVPAYWPIHRLQDVAHVQTGVAKGRKLRGEETVEVPYLRVANVQDGYIDLSEIKYIRLQQRELARYQLQPGDVVLTEGGDFDKLGRGFVWDGQMPGMVHQNHVFAVRADQRRVLPAFLGYFVQSSYAKSYFLTVAHRTTNLASINSTKLRAFPVPIPTLREQARIVEVLSVVDRKIEVETARVEAIMALFSSLLHHLMTGKVRVHDVVPTLEFEEVG